MWWTRVGARVAVSMVMVAVLMLACKPRGTGPRTDDGDRRPRPPPVREATLRILRLAPAESTVRVDVTLPGRERPMSGTARIGALDVLATPMTGADYWGVTLLDVRSANLSVHGPDAARPEATSPPGRLTPADEELLATMLQRPTWGLSLLDAKIEARVADDGRGSIALSISPAPCRRGSPSPCRLGVLSGSGLLLPINLRIAAPGAEPIAVAATLAGRIERVGAASRARLWIAGPEIELGTWERETPGDPGDETLGEDPPAPPESRCDSCTRTSAMRNPAPWGGWSQGGSR